MTDRDDHRVYVPGKWFPIQGTYGSVRPLPYAIPAGRIPWALAVVAYEVYTRAQGPGQSMERLAERGGFGWAELLALLRGSYSSAAITKSTRDLGLNPEESS